MFEGSFDPGATYGQPCYGVDRDARHFYFLEGSNNVVRPSRIEVVQNWLDEFKARVAK